jgi:hypothetical protein
MNGCTRHMQAAAQTAVQSQQSAIPARERRPFPPAAAHGAYEARARGVGGQVGQALVIITLVHLDRLGDAGWGETTGNNK